MYLRRIETDDVTVAQGALKIEFPGDLALTKEEKDFVDQIFQLCFKQFLGLPFLSVGSRAVIEPNGNLQVVFSCVSQWSKREWISDCWSLLIKVDGVGGISVNPAYRDNDMASMLTAPKLERFEYDVACMSTRAGDVVLPDCGLSEPMAGFLDLARIRDQSIGHELLITASHPPRELLREARVNLAHLEDDPGVPVALLAGQKSLIERAMSADFHVRETLLLVQDVSLPQLGNNGVDGPSFCAVEESETPAFDGLVHPSVMFGWPDRLEFGEVTAFYPRQAILPLFLMIVEPVLAMDLLFIPRQGITPKRKESIPAERPNEKFLFVSYARLDRGKVDPIVAELRSCGISLWIDDSIEIGSLWHDELEYKLASCCGVLVLVSPALAKSKYCRREVKYADGLDKPIFPVLLEETELEGALSMIISEANYLVVGSAEFGQRLLRSIRDRLE